MRSYRAGIFQAIAVLLLGIGSIAAINTAGAAVTAGSLTAAFAQTSVWDSGYQAQYTITNSGGSPVTGWTVAFDLPANTTISTSWDAVLSTSGNRYLATNRSYNGTVAPGQSVTFGFIARGKGLPASCTVNSVNCEGGGPLPTPSPSPSPSPTPTPPLPGSLPVAPYIDMGSWPTPVLSAEASAAGVRSFTLAFITASTCKAMWFNAYDPRTGWQRDEIDKLRAGGGDVKISFGGASGAELAQACTDVTALTAEYQAVIDAYALRYIDFDIEGSAVAEPASIARRSQAMAALQRANPGLRISLTLPVLPEGLDANGLGVVQAAKDAGVQLDMVNVMAMDYYRDGDYGAFATQAGQATFDQLKAMFGRPDADTWKMVGVTPMLGKNDDGRTYGQAAARQLLGFAQSKHLGMLAFWELTRDRNACIGALYKCTNIPQTPYEFSSIFSQYSG